MKLRDPLLLTVLLGLACADEADNNAARKVLTSAKDGWTATQFTYWESETSDDLQDWTQVTAAEFDGQSTWTFTDERNPLAAGQGIDDFAVGEVTAPDGVVVDMDWEVWDDEFDGEPELILFLYEDAVLHQGTWQVDLVEMDRERMMWDIVAESVDGYRIEAELELRPR